MHSSSWIDPMMKPVAPDPRHSRTPDWTLDWPTAAPERTASAAAATTQTVAERVMAIPPVLKSPRRLQDLLQNGNGRPLSSPTPASCYRFTVLLQIPAEPLDAPTGFFQIFGPGRVGDAERRAGAECGALHHGDPFGVEQLGDEVLVGLQPFAGRRQLADRPAAGRIDIERALRLRAGDAFRLVEHGDHEIAAFLEHLVV